MSPTIDNLDEIPIDADFDLKKWIKEIEGAENLMSEVEAKANTLEAKVDALLLQVTQPIVQEQEENKEQQQHQQEK